MMKRVVTLAFMMICVCAWCFVGEASPHDPYLDGDSNYIKCTRHQDLVCYVDRSSLKVHLYNPPEYIISIDMVSVEMNPQMTSYRNRKTGTVLYRYNYDDREMYVNTKDYFSNGNDEWMYLEPTAGWAKGGRFVMAGDIAFYLAYNTGFYKSTEKLSDLVDE